MAMQPSTTADRPAADAKPYLDAVLHPHRSLGPRGFQILMGIICAVSFVAGMAFVSMGAWPVFGFFGLDVAAIYVAFRLNYRSGRLVEQVRVFDDSLEIECRRPGKPPQSWRFNPYWAQVVLQPDRYGTDQLVVRSHGVWLVLGHFLLPEERAEFAAALRDALARARGHHLA